jgi:hypothetical protein
VTAKGGKKKKPPKPPRCVECGSTSELVSGDVIYPNFRKVHDQWFWRCPHCESSYVGCHGKTQRPLGRPAGPELRDARSKLHKQMVDPVWENAIASEGYEPEDHRARVIILGAARTRVYRFLAHKLRIDVEDCHIGMFDLETCRDAWRAMRGVTYSEIRQWVKQQDEENAAGNADRQKGPDHENSGRA